MPPKKKARGRGRTVHKKQDEDRPEREMEKETEPEIAYREGVLPPATSRSRPRPSVDVSETHEVSTQTVIELSSEEGPTVHQKKKKRVSKKEIPEYKWTDEGTRKFAKFIKDHPKLYDKKQKDWPNVAAKYQLWKRAGDQQKPPATGEQCKKHYENMRTRVGKIMNKEKKSGAGQPERSVRNQEIMDTWGFLTEYIVRGILDPSKQFSIQGSSETVTGTAEQELDDDLSSAGSHVPDIQGKRRRIGKRSRPSVDASTSAPSITETNHSEVVMQMLSEADSMGCIPTISKHRKIVHHFTRLLERHMQTIPEDSLDGFQIDCLKLVQTYKQRGQATATQQQLQPKQEQLHHTYQFQQQEQQQQHPQASHSWKSSQASQYSQTPQFLQASQQQRPASQGTDTGTCTLAGLGQSFSRESVSTTSEFPVSQPALFECPEQEYRSHDTGTTLHTPTVVVVSPGSDGAHGHSVSGGGGGQVPNTLMACLPTVSF